MHAGCLTGKRTLHEQVDCAGPERLLAAARKLTTLPNPCKPFRHRPVSDAALICLWLLVTMVHLSRAGRWIDRLHVWNRSNSQTGLL